LLGTVTADLVKVAISALAGGLAGLALGTVITVAGFPIACAIAVSLLVAFSADAIDKKFGLTEKLVEKISTLVAPAPLEGPKQTHIKSSEQGRSINCHLSYQSGR
jgi:hypothetical protein